MSAKAFFFFFKYPKYEQTNWFLEYSLNPWIVIVCIFPTTMDWRCYRFLIFLIEKSHLSPALFEELPFKMKKKTSNCIIFKVCKKKASARNVLLGCIFLYIHICFYTARIFLPLSSLPKQRKIFIIFLFFFFAPIFKTFNSQLGLSRITL